MKIAGIFKQKNNVEFVILYPYPIIPIKCSIAWNVDRLTPFFLNDFKILSKSCIYMNKLIVKYF